MCAGTKALEIATESIPEGIIQINGLVIGAEGEIKDFQVASVASSVAATGFMISEVHFGTIQR